MQEEKITLQTDNGEAVDFYVLEETRINGMNYLMVTDSNRVRTGSAMSLKMCPARRTVRQSMSLWRMMMSWIISAGSLRNF